MHHLISVGNSKMCWKSHFFWDTQDLKPVAQAVHEVVRSGVADPDFCCQTKDWFEAARHLGQKNIYDIWRPAVDALHGTGAFVNASQVGYMLRV